MALQKGICKNFGECDLADQKEIQEVEKTNFVCEECGKPLFPVDAKPTGPGGGSSKLKMIIGGAVAAVVLIGGGTWYALSRDSKSEEAPADTTIQAPIPTKDSITAVPNPVKEATDKDSKGTKESEPTTEPTPQPEVKTGILRYGNYVGNKKNGVPDGTGKLTFTRAYQLNAEHTAQPGEYIQGIFENGLPTFVTYYKSDGTVVKIKLR